MGSLHDTVTWYRIRQTGWQKVCNSLQNKAISTSQPWLFFVLDVPVCSLPPSRTDFIPCDNLMQRAYWAKEQGDSSWRLLAPNYLRISRTNVFLDYHCRKTTKAVPVRWRYDVKLVSCDWSSGSCGRPIRGKFSLEINQSVKTPWQEYMGVSRSYSWVPCRALRFVLNPGQTKRKSSQVDASSHLRRLAFTCDRVAKRDASWAQVLCKSSRIFVSFFFFLGSDSEELLFSL